MQPHSSQAAPGRAASKQATLSVATSVTLSAPFCPWRDAIGSLANTQAPDAPGSVVIVCYNTIPRSDPQLM